MGWFDSQLRQRMQQDNDVLADALEDVVGAVMGKTLAHALDDYIIAQTAIGEIFRCFHLKQIARGNEKDGTIDEQLDRQLRPHGILRRNVKLESGWYKYAVGPMLCTLKESGKAVALIPGRFSGYTYLDFSTGKRVRLNRRTEVLLDEEAVCFYRPLPLKALTMADLLIFVYEQLSVSDIAAYLGVMGLSTLLGMLLPLFTKWMFGPVLESGSYRVLLALTSFMICFSISRVCISVMQNMVMDRIRAKQSIAVQAAVVGRIISLPVQFFKDYSSGELYQRSMTIQDLCGLLMNTIGTTGMMSVFSLVYLAQIFSFAPALAVPSLCIILATAAVSLITTFMQMKRTKLNMEMSSKTSGMTYSIITGIQKIKLAGAEKRVFSRWARQYAKEASLTYNPPAFIKLNGAITTAVSLVGMLVLYAAALAGGVTAADYYAFNATYSMVAAAFMSLSGIAVTAANIRPTLEIAKPIMEAVPEVPEGKVAVNELQGGIELSNVCFRYDDSMPNVIDNLSLQVHKGEYLAIVGTTGCGKSTLLRLLLGFEVPQKGVICYDHHDITTLDPQSLRRHIGTVMQDSGLFMGDIFSNIVISAPQLTLEDAWEAARIASIDEDIRKMPMGMNTLISEGQGGISGGQRQRLMIARAVAAKPSLLIFDEATSALDNITQKKVSEAIDSLNCTRIVVAHRLSTIRHCDRIIVMDKGHVVEDGTYEQLIEKNGVFAELVARQRIDAGESH